MEHEDEKMEMESSEDKSKKYGKYEKWEIESAAHCLTEAEEIRADAEKMKYVKMCLEEDMVNAKNALGKLSEITSIDDLKAVRKKKLDKKSEV